VQPEQALEAARRAVTEARRAGAYERDFSDVTINPTHHRVTSDQLMEWAVIEPDPGLVISTRRLGAPIAWLKRTLMHLLRQYHGQLESQQTRFNVHILARVVEQEERLAIVEDWLRDETPGATGFQPPPAHDRRHGPLEQWPAGPARPRHEWLARRQEGDEGRGAGGRPGADPGPGPGPGPGPDGAPPRRP
jgi:hypothetical protein